MPGFRRRVFELLERVHRRHLPSRLFDAFLVALILGDVLATILQTTPPIQEAYGPALQSFDRFCVLVFALEYAARLWTAPDHPMLRARAGNLPRLRFALTPMMIIDFLSLLVFVVEIAFPGIGELRLLRLVRFLKLARYTPALKSIGNVMYDVRRPLVACVVLFGALVLAAATVMYLLERDAQPDRLGDMPSAIWWAAAFLTKLGQIDVLPHTLVGRLAAIVFMLLGIGFIALPVGIIGRGFYDEIRRRDFVVTFAMVSRVPLFASLDVATISQLVGMLKARKVADGTVIIHRGDAADAMYFIADGEVAVTIDGQARRLGTGDFFGEMALLESGRRTATVLARGTCELLVLDADDFNRLLRKNAGLETTVRKTAAARREAMASAETE
jgi:voltage-gated potassium channel